jgi:hypothetical protein
MRLPIVALLIAGCSGSVDGGSIRAVNGALSPQSFGLARAEVLAHAADGRVLVAPVLDGKFSLALPVEVDYRLLIVEPQSDGVRRIVSHVVWPIAGAPYWAHLSAGAPLELGSIEPESCPVSHSCHDAGATPTTDAGTAHDAGMVADDGGYGPYDDGGWDGEHHHHGCDDGGAPDGAVASVDGGAIPDAGAVADGGATACDPDGGAPDAKCSAKDPPGCSGHVDEHACQAAEAAMNAACGG